MIDYLKLMQSDENPVPETGNKYLHVMEDFDAGHQAQFNASTTLAIGDNPDEVARKKRISNLLGVPLAAVDGDPETAKQLAAQKTLENDSQGAPALKQKYTDVDFARLAHDQSASLGSIERIVRNFAAGFGGDFIGSGIAGMGHTLNSLQRILRDDTPYVPLGAGLVDIGETTKKYWQGLANKDQAFGDQVVRGVGQITGQLPLIMVSPLLGIGMMYGQGADQMKEKIAADKAAQKADQVNQDLEILSGGVITGVTEWVSSKLLLKPPQLLALKNRLLSYSLKVAAGGATEGIQETLENIGQDLTHIAATNPDSKVAFGEALQAGGVGAIVGTLASGVINGALHIRARGMQQAFQSLSDASKVQKLKERDEGTYQGFADAVAQHLAATSDGAVENIYIDANTFNQVMTAAQIDPKEVKKLVPSLNTQLDEAAVTGGDVVIPLNEFVGKLAGTEVGDNLTPHLRSAPGAVSIAEAEAAAKMSTDIQARADEIMAKQRQTSEFVKSANEVQQTIHEQIKATGFYTDAVSQSYSKMVRDFYVTTAASMGISPTELYQLYPYKVVSGEVGPGTVTQGQLTTETQEIKAWAGNAEIIRGFHGTNKNFSEFRPQPALRNTEGGVEEVVSPAFFFSTDKSTAKMFARDKVRIAKEIKGETGGRARVKEYHLKLEKPLDFRVTPEVMGQLHSEGSSFQNWDGVNPYASSLIEEIAGYPAQDWNSVQAALDDPDVVSKLIDLGYDSAKLREPDGGESIAVFSAAQIKPVNKQKTPTAIGSLAGADNAGGLGSVSASDKVKVSDLMGEVNTLQRVFQRSASDKRGGFNPATLTTILTQASDYSTFLHETAHFFLTTYADLAMQPNAPPRVKADMQALLDWFGVKDIETWSAMPLDEQRPFHEQFAYNYEIYLFEGKAPNVKIQGIFERVSAWLKRIYVSIRDELNQVYRQEHGKDLAILTGEIREVMDRMLASDKQIQQAEQIRSMSPIFQSQEQSGMSDEEWVAYEEMQKDAHEAALGEHRAASLRQMKWLENAKGRVLKDLQAQTRELRKAVVAKVTEEVNSLPIYRAQALLKVASDEVETLAVVDAFGYSSLQELQESIAAHPKKADYIRRKTDQRMLEEHGELTDPKALAEAVDRAVHNEARARFIGVELRHLAKAQRPVRVIQEAARQAARSILGKRAIMDIRPHEFAAAEARAAQAAEKAMKKGDTAAATQAKEHQLLQNQLAAEALRARQVVTKSLESFKKVFASDKKLGKGRDMNYVQVARSILAHYGIGATEEPASSYLAKIKAYDPEFYAEIEPMITAHQAQSKPLKRLTLDEFQDLNDQIQALWHLSRRNKQIEINGELVDRTAAVTELNEAIRELGDKPILAGYHSARSTWDKAKIQLMGVRAALRRVEAWVDAMDRGNPGGPFRKYIWNPVSEAVTAYRIAKKDHLKKFVQLLQDNPHLFRMGPVAAPEIGYTFNRGRGNTSELLHALLHTGNQSNKRKLLLGRGWATLNEDGETMDSSNWDAFIERAQREGILTKEHYDFAQKVWDLLAEMKPAAQKAHRQMYGFYFNEITSDPVQTPWGVYAGGYVPAVTDPGMVTDAAMRNEQETTLVDNSFMFPSTGRGFTKGRVEYNKPLLLNIGYLASHMDKVLRFTYIEPAVKDVARIVKTNRSFAEAMDAIDPTVRGDMLVPWLQRTAMQTVSIPSKGQAGRAADAVFSYLRVNTGMQIMVGNITNTLQQFTGLSIAALKVKPKYLRNALWQYVRQPKETTAMIAERSPFMDTRINSYQFELQRTMNEILLDPNKYDKLRDFASQHGYFLQQGTQGIVDTLTWVGAYNQAVEQGIPENAAVRQADAAVRMTQSSFAAEDISRIEVNSAFVRMFTHFYNYFNMMANITGTEFATAIRTMGLKKGAGRLVYVYAAGFMIPAVLSEIIVQSIGGFDDDDDDYTLGDAMLLFFGSQARALAAMAPGLGQVATAAAGRFTSAFYDDRISTSPAVSTLEAVVSAPFSVYKAIAEDGSWKKASRDMLTMLGLLTRLPLGQLGKPVGFLMDVEQGRATPENAGDWARGLLSGKDVNRKQ